MLNFGLFWAALLKMSVFYPTRNFRQFWADPTFSAVRSIFWPKRRPKMLQFHPTQNFGDFWAALLKMSGFYPILNFGHFLAPSLVTLLTLSNFQFNDLKHPKHPKHQNGHKPCFCENAEGRRRFHQKTRTILFVPPPVSFFVVLFLFVLCCCLCFFCSSAPPPPWFLTLKVKGEGGPKNGQNSLWGKNIEKIRGPKNGQNSIWGKTGHL